MSISDLVNALGLLTPYDVAGENKVRVGHQLRDGGYVMLDRFRPEQNVYSFGIGGNVAFDADFAQRGHQIFMFDHTIPGLPEQNPNFNYVKEGIAGVSNPAEHLYSLQDHLTRRGHDNDDMLLKLDIEGHEWRVFDETPSETLALFEQIVFEAHRMERIAFREGGQRMVRALSKLNETHTLFHVHCNNVRPAVMVDGFPIPPLMEFSYVRSDLVQRKASRTVYPTEFDRPNSLDRPEVPLFFYPFLPTSSRSSDLALIGQRMAQCAERLDLQAKQVAARERRRVRRAASDATQQTGAVATTPA